MSESTPMFFPERSRRVVFDDVIAAFPFPVAITYARLQEELDRQEPIAAAWQLRDAFEALIKFAASVAIADGLQAGLDPETARSVAGLLLKPAGLSLGDWHTLVELPLRPLDALAKQGRLAESGRCLPALFGVFFEPKNGKRSALNRLIDGDDQSFVNWRNRVFGHGVFKRDRAWYAAETVRWLPHLHLFLEALRPVLDGWRLIERLPDGTSIAWLGAPSLPPSPRHPHEPGGPPRSMLLVRDRPPRELSFGPMLSVQDCRSCGQPVTFFFDRNRYDAKKDRHRTFFLEYFGGHDREHPDWDQTRHLAARLPVAFAWTREAYDQGELAEGLGIVFRDFETEYRRPDYLLDAIWAIVASRPKGIIHLVGPEGTGKTYVVRGLEREGPARHAPVLAYHLLAGKTGHYQTFMTELNDRVSEQQLRMRTPGLQTRGATTPEALQAELVEYLTVLMRENRLDNLIVALDALDEQPDPDPKTPALTDFLPPAERLPAGCFLLLTSREAVRPKARADLDRLRSAGADAFATVRLDPAASTNRGMLRAYLLAPADPPALPDPFRTPAHADALIDRAGGVFLYVYHLSRALSAGAYADVAALPEGHQFYPAYLARLRARVGVALFDDVYLPALLLLSAARQPVTLRQLHDWGIPRDRLAFALLNLSDFLRVHKVRLWHDSLAEPGSDPEHRYEIAHEAFLRFVHVDPALSALLRHTHARIVLAAIPTPPTRWADLDPTDDVQLYDLRHVLPHLTAAGRDEAVALLLSDQAYADTCLSAGNHAYQKARALIAEDLYDRALTVYRKLVEQDGRVELADDLASALMNKGVALGSQGRLAEAVVVYDQAIASFARLVEQDSRVELANDLANALVNKANAVQDQGRLAEAEAMYDQAITIRTRLVEQEGRVELANDLANALMNKANAAQRQGRLAEAVAVYDQAIAIRSRLVEQEGRVELANDLATALMNKGVALGSQGRLAEAVAVYDQAITIRSRLVEQEGRVELTSDLAAALVNKANALQFQGRLSEAVAVYDQAIASFARLVEQEGRVELANDLATALMNKGVALGSQGRLAEAVAVYDQAITIRSRLVEQEGRDEVASDLAEALTNKAIAVQLQGRLAEAVAVTDQAISRLTRLVDQEGRVELANTLATALMNKANAAQRQGRLAEAVAVYDQAIAIRSRLVEQEGRVELANDLAAALMGKGVALGSQGRLAEAVVVCDQAIAIRSRLVEQEGRVELANDLAGALMNKANALLDQGRLAEAEAVYHQVIAIRTRLVEQEGRVELANDLAAALMNKGVVLRKQGRLAEAEAVYDKAIAIRTRLVEQEGRDELASDLTGALMNKANAVQLQGRLSEAVAVYDQAIAGFTRLVEREGHVELADDLAGALMNKGVALLKQGRLTEAEAMYDHAITIRTRLVEHEGRVELANHLADALVNKGVALENQGRLAEAIVVYDQAVASLSRLVEQEGRVELAKDLANALVNKAIVLEKQERWPDALACYEQAIYWGEVCIQAGMVNLLSVLLRNIRYRLTRLLDLGRWSEAAADVVRLLNHAAPALESGSPPEAVMKELGAMLVRLRELPDDAWSAVEAGLGPWANVVGSWVRQPG
jgi:tetratricopeptide (TPR) repeat protein